MKLVDYKSPLMRRGVSTGILLESFDLGLGVGEVYVKTADGVIRVKEKDVSPSEGTHVILAVNKFGGVYSLDMVELTPEGHLDGFKVRLIPTDLKHPLAYSEELAKEVAKKGTTRKVKLVSMPCFDYINKVGEYEKLVSMQRVAKNPYEDLPNALYLLEHLAKLSEVEGIDNTDKADPLLDVPRFYTSVKESPNLGFEGSFFPHKFGLCKLGVHKYSRLSVFIPIHFEKHPTTQFLLEIKNGAFRFTMRDGLAHGGNEVVSNKVDLKVFGDKTLLTAYYEGVVFFACTIDEEFKFSNEFLTSTSELFKSLVDRELMPSLWAYR